MEQPSVQWGAQAQVALAVVVVEEVPVAASPQVAGLVLQVVAVWPVVGTSWVLVIFRNRSEYQSTTLVVRQPYSSVLLVVVLLEPH
jgi:hypothetical protein